VRVLLDACVWGGAKVELERLGHDVVWCGDLGDDPGDEAILSAAKRERRVLVTLDKDFGELAVVREVDHAGIVRLVGFAALRRDRACRAPGTTGPASHSTRPSADRSQPNR
jgi:predicted nuclease of predicted toxin-antitoxin system